MEEGVHILGGANGLMGALVMVLPVCVLIFLFIHFKKKREGEARESNRFGRRGKKDHIWQILKEYHRKKNQVGSSIEESFLFERPNPADLHDRLVKGLTFIARQDAKRDGVRFRRVKYPERIEGVEDYFDALEEETAELNRSRRVSSRRVEGMRGKGAKSRGNRRRYVILYRVRHREVISPWMAIEVELIRQVGRDGKDRDVVVVNRELDVEMEFKWIAPLLDEKIRERTRRAAEELKRRAREERKRTRRSWP